MVGKSRRDGDNEESSLFDVIPEGCIASALSFTAPLDTCRLATVSKIFKSAADSDAVWSRFLPSDYRDILARSEGGSEVLDQLVSKKHLFFYLVHHPLLIDSSSMSFFLDKPTGKKCFTISARKLAITWGDTPRYWAFRPLPESRFPEVAELNSVCWLEIRGKIKASMLSPNTTYVAYFVFKMNEGSYGFYSPAHMTIKAPGSSKSETRKVYLQDEGGPRPRYQIVPRRMTLFNRIRTPFLEAPQPAKKEDDDKMLPKVRKDGWQEVAIGEVTTRVGEDGDISMSVLEIEGGNWKSGLMVEGIELRPKVVLE